jgi:hypothetical protein
MAGCPRARPEAGRQIVQRDFERDDPRRRYRPDDDPRDDPRERYGNEEDPYSRDYRRAYAEQQLPRRMQDDRPYNRPGYEPEVGRSGGRANVDLEPGDPYRGYRERYGGERHNSDWERSPRRSPQSAGDERTGEPWQGGYYGQGRRWSGRPFGDSSSRMRGPGFDDSREAGQSTRGDRYGRQEDSFFSSPYDSGDFGGWYGGDTGMGDPGTSQFGTPPGGGWRSGQGHWPSNQADRPGYGQEQRPRDRYPYDTGRVGDAGRFGGRGPRGYQRSDERIREDVCELLTRHGAIDASDMEVEVHAATVILRGTTDSGRIRRLTEEMVEDVPGVRDVQNELRVRRPDAGTPDGRTGPAGFSGDRAGSPAYGVSAGLAQPGPRWQVRETMDVVGADGEQVGTVKAVHGTDFLLDRPMARDLLVPFSAVRTVDGERIMLGVRSGEIDDQHWPTSELTGNNQGAPSR